MNKEQVLILPCEPDCPFGRRCGDKYKDGDCRDKATDVEGILGSAKVTEAINSTVIFTLTDPIIKPSHKVVIKSGVAHISEVVDEKLSRIQS